MFIGQATSRPVMILKNSQFDYWDRNIKYKSKKINYVAKIGIRSNGTSFNYFIHYRLSR